MTPDEKRIFNVLVDEYCEWRKAEVKYEETKFVRKGALLALSKTLHDLGWMHEAHREIVQRLKGEETLDDDNKQTRCREKLISELRTMLDIGLDKKSSRRLAEIIEELAKIAVFPA